MPRQYVDSNVFFYAKIADRIFGKACAALLEDIMSGGTEASTSALAVLEVANAMRKYGLSRQISKEVQAILSLGMEVHSVDPADARQAAEIHSETKISPYDCAHAAIMRRNGLTEIISADNEFDKVAWLRRLDPRSLMGEGNAVVSDERHDSTREIREWRQRRRRT